MPEMNYISMPVHVQAPPEGVMACLEFMQKHLDDNHGDIRSAIWTTVPFRQDGFMLNLGYVLLENP